MTTFTVDMARTENYLYTGEWMTETVEADTKEEAIEYFKEYLLDSLLQEGYAIEEAEHEMKEWLFRVAGYTTGQ